MAIDWSKLIYANSSTPYLDSYKKLADEYRTQADTDVARINENRDTDLTKSNAGYDNTARQNYINYMQAQKRLPSQLNALGIRGGASESSLLRLGTNYGSNVASNEAARASAADSIRQAYAQQIADYNKDLNERLAQAEATAEQNQINWENEQREKDLQYFSGAIEGLYNNRSDYQKLIQKLQASNDPNKDYKIMLATRAMNNIASSGSGGGGRSYGGYGSYGSSGTSGSGSPTTSDLVNAAKNAIYSAAGKTATGFGLSGVTHNINSLNKSNKKNSKTSSKSGYRIKGEPSTNWQ